MIDFNARYNQLSAQYRAACAAEDAAWDRVAGADYADAAYSALVAEARRASDVRRRLSAELDAELGEFTGQVNDICAAVQAAIDAVEGPRGA